MARRGHLAHRSLTYAVIALAMTLLIISLEVPSSYDEMIASFAQIPDFAVSFAILVVFLAMSAYAHRLRDGLELDEVERAAARSTLRAHSLHVGIGLLVDRPRADRRAPDPVLRHRLLPGGRGAGDQRLARRPGGREAGGRDGVRPLLLISSPPPP